MHAFMLVVMAYLASGTSQAAAVPLHTTGGGAGGIYTAAQADRGKLVYEQYCGSCHGSSLRGGTNEFAAPPLVGPFFFEVWSGRPVEELFRYTGENMPPDQTALSETAYLDVTAYVLQVLKYPAGHAELTVESPDMKRSIERQP